MSLRLREMFRHYRTANSLSFRQMETLTGISRAALYRFESGQSIDESAFSALVRFIVDPHDSEKDARLLDEAKSERAKAREKRKVVAS
jgi:transcriptional regulator with XRE-family HTH domain